MKSRLSLLIYTSLNIELTVMLVYKQFHLKINIYTYSLLNNNLQLVSPHINTVYQSFKIFKIICCYTNLKNSKHCIFNK